MAQKVESRTLRIVGLLLALAGAVLVAFIAGAGGRLAMQQPRDCPTPKAVPAGNPVVYLSEPEIRLGGRVCVAIDRLHFFDRERAELKQAQDGLDEAQRQLAAVPQGTSTTSAQTNLTQARNAFDALPGERTLFIFLDDVKVPGQGFTIAVQPPNRLPRRRSSATPKIANPTATTKR